MKKFISVILVALMVINTNILTFAYAVNIRDTRLLNADIVRIEVKSKLETTQTEEFYDGTTVDNVYTDTPPTGYVYALVELSVDYDEYLETNKFQLEVDGKKYDVINDLKFLVNHNYTLLKEQVFGVQNGFVAFLIPDKYISSDKVGWSVYYSEQEVGIYEGYSEVPNENGIVEQHKLIEQQIIADYKANGVRTLNNAAVYQNIYGTAPLTAVIIFETPESESVTVSVEGKTEDTTISYTTNASTHHEVQIFGLYANYLNKVTLTTSSGSTKQFEIQTDPIPEDMTIVEKQVSDGVQLNDQLFFICDANRTVFDKNGDIRWYMYGIKCDADGVHEFDFEAGSFWFSVDGYNPNLSTIYCMSFAGKIRGKYLTYGKSSHHDATLTPDGKLLYYSKWNTNSAELSLLNPETGETTEYYDPIELLDSSLGSLEYSSKNTTWDYSHANTVEYISDNNSLLLSL